MIYSKNQRLPGSLSESVGCSDSFVRELLAISNWSHSLPANPSSHLHLQPDSVEIRLPISHSIGLEPQGSIVVFRTGISLYLIEHGLTHLGLTNALIMKGILKMNLCLMSIRPKITLEVVLTNADWFWSVFGFK